ncbi:hypothetical protein TNCV_1811221 [Trichonephila clavipes]|nr:hypothetical protein TNCV_1811221 [Trichonephila clavipes]
MTSAKLFDMQICNWVTMFLLLSGDQLTPQKIVSGVKSQDLGGQFTGPKREIRRSPKVSFDCGTSCVTCCAVLLEPPLLDIMIVQFRNEKLVIKALYRSPLTDIVAFIVFEGTDQ